MLGHTTEIKNAIDVGTMVIHREVVKKAKGQLGFDSLRERTLKKRLPKPSHIRFSDAWDDPGELHSPEAQNYAMRDNWVPIDLYKAYKNLPELTVQMSQEAMKVRDVVDIIPSDGTAVVPIAKAVIKQIERKAITFGMDLTKPRSLVKVIAMYDAQVINRPFPYQCSHNTSVVGVQHVDGGGAVDQRGDSYVQMSLEGKVIRQCTLFPFCLHDVSVCKGVSRRSCLFLMDMELEPPWRGAEVDAVST